MKSVVVIPAYKPDETLIGLVEEITSEGFGVLVINDGSGPGYKRLFEAVSNVEGVKIIDNERNLGKGGALKHGFRRIKEFFPDAEYFVTADADGQHLVVDIKRVFDELYNKAKMVLAVRIRKGKIPFRSRFGNDLSKLVYTILTGHYFTDNQSGLRGFTIDNVDWLVKVRGEKYDYEMNMLFYADKQAIPITTIPIDAIYIDDNGSSHFNPVKDTARIYLRLFSTAWPSIASLLTFEFLTLTLSLIFHYRFLGTTIMSAGVVCLFMSIVFYKFIVFRNFKYRDMLRSVVYGISRFVIYTAGTALCRLTIPKMPMFLALNLVILVFIPVEYYFRKGMHVASYNDVNKER